MKKATIFNLLLSIFIFSFIPYFYIISQTQITKPELKFGGQIRFRTELDGRFFDNNAKVLFYNLLRTRFNAEAIINQNIRTFVQLQDSRNFGETSTRFWRGTLDGTSDNLDLHQGWLELKDLFADNLTIKMGRMMFATNSERIIGNLEWHNVGRNFDGATATYKYDDWQARVFGFLLSSNELLMTSAAPQSAKMLGGFDLNIPYIPAGNVYLYYDMNDKAIPSAAVATSSLPKLSRYTFGAFTKNENPGFIWELEAAYQFGTIDTLPRFKNNTRSDISAYLVSLFAGYKEGNISVGAGLDAYSGDKTDTDNYEGFDHLFLTLHKFYGAMDFLPFTVLPAGGLRQSPEGTNKGMMMPNIRASWAPVKNWKFDLSLMSFSTFEPYKYQPKNETNEESSSDFGKEIDFLVSSTVANGVNAQIGFSAFLPGTIIKETNYIKGMGKDNSYWAYAMISIDF